MRALLAGLGLTAIAVAAAAQELKTIPGKFVNGDHLEITDFQISVTPTGCQGSQHYTKVGDRETNGVSLFRYANTTPWLGGTLCSQGVWFYGNGEFGGKLENVLIKGGKFYWIR